MQHGPQIWNIPGKGLVLNLLQRRHQVRQGKVANRPFQTVGAGVNPLGITHRCSTFQSGNILA